MKTNLAPLIALLFGLLSCTQVQKDKVHYNSGPKVVEAKGYVVPTDSMVAPKEIRIDERKLTKISSGKSVIYHTNTNGTLAGKPKTVAAGVPLICTPGQGNFELPENLIVANSVSNIKYPEIVKSKDPSFGNTNTGYFSTYSKMQGLSHDQVLSILEDRYGNIWLGTEGAGVTKFDGRNFTHFTVENGLSHNNVMSMLKDKNDNIWFGHYDGLFDKYDGRTITQYQLPEGIRGIIRCFIEDNDGNIWFNSNIGVIKYDGVSFLLYSYKQGLQLKYITSIAKDKRGNLWFGGWSGIVKFDGKSFSHYSQKEGLLSEYVLSILVDKAENLWIGHESGVTKFDSSTFTHYTTKEGVPTGSIKNIIEDHLGDLWFGSGEGLSKFDHTNFFHFTSRDGLEENNIVSMLTDKMHNLWIGTYGGGVSKYNPHHFTHYTSLEDLRMDNVAGMASDSAGNIWFCHEKEGVVKFNGEYFEYFTDTDLSTTYKFTRILCDTENTIWLAGPEGIAKYINGEFTHFFRKDFSSFSNIRAMAVDPNGNIWFSSWGEGVSVFDGQKLIQFKTENGISANYNISILCDNDGNIWIGSWEKGVTKLIPIDLKNKPKYACTHYSEKNGLSQKSVYTILEDSSENLWFGTWGGGVSRFDGRYFTHITTKEGLINNFVYSILEDQNANIWLGTRLGLSQLSNSVQEEWVDKDITSSEKGINPGIVNYSFEDGFLGIGCKTEGLLEDNKGNIWVLTDNMITTFPLEENFESIESIAPNVQMTAIKLFNEKIDWSDLLNVIDTSFIIGNGVKVGKFKYSGLSKWYSIPENLSLASNNNYLTFNYIGITQKKANKVMYKYVLEGNDENWSALTPLIEAYYGNLPHGKYTFKVKAMSSEGFWSNEFHYPFTIRPPWWQTWWAYGLYAFALITLLWRLHKYQQTRTLRIERERTREKELAQAKEIEKAYTELQATQKQLIQSEKMASLGELTAGIAHEIQNPLNFVNNFSEVNVELIDELNDELTTGNVQLAKEIAGNIKDNEEKIIFHGKRADAIVKGMLQHSRTSSGIKEPTDINALADEYLRLAYHGLRAKDKSFNATMHTDYDESIGLINIVPQDIGRVILNLITNAFYAVCPPPPEGGLKSTRVDYEPTIIITTRKWKSPLGDLGAEISVKDNGSGIPKNVIDKIFQPFFTTKPTGQGTGLGLSLSYDIVKAHGGELKVETKEGEGTEFIIILPQQETKTNR